MTLRVMVEFIFNRIIRPRQAKNCHCGRFFPVSYGHSQANTMAAAVFYGHKVQKLVSQAVNSCCFYGLNWRKQDDVAVLPHTKPACHLPLATCHLQLATCNLPLATCHFQIATCHAPSAQFMPAGQPELIRFVPCTYQRKRVTIPATNAFAAGLFLGEERTEGWIPVRG